MKHTGILFLLFSTLAVRAQDNIYGRYKTYFGDEMTLKPDKTFIYTFHFDLDGSWTAGTYRMENDTIFFKEVPTFNTIQVTRGSTHKRYA